MPRLTCEISQSLWDALHRASRDNRETLSHIVSRALADRLQVEHETLFQVSTAGALVKGVFDGAVSIATLREHGDFGLGTFVDLDGEMIALDGAFYQIRSDGSIRPASDGELVPFAIVTHFAPERALTIPPFATIAEMLAHLNALRGSDNLFYAVRLRGRFGRVRVRVACKAAPHATLVEAVAHQAEFRSDAVSGTIAGFWTPAYVKGLGIPGWHVHFLSDDRRFGGHVLDANGADIELALKHLDDFRVSLPETAAFIASAREVNAPLAPRYAVVGDSVARPALPAPLLGASPGV